MSTLSAADCRPPIDVYEELASRPGLSGSALMESAALGSPGGTRSLLVPSAVARLVARRGTVDLEPLSAAGEILIAGMPTKERFEPRPADPSLSDRERVLAPSVLDAVRKLANLVRDDEPGAAIPAGVYAAFSYELVDQWESLPQRPLDPANDPDIHAVLALDSILFDHEAGEVHVVTRSLGASRQAAADRRHESYVKALTDISTYRRARHHRAVADKEAGADVSDDVYLEGVRKFLRHIERGDIFQGVLSRGLTMRSDAEPLSVYRVLRERNPSPYMFHLDLGDGALFGASPETSVKLTGRKLEIRPIAGTAARGFQEDGTIDEELDTRLAVGLLLDAKEQAEHAMLVDLARNDVARVAVPGTRRVSEPFTIEKYSHVQHLVSGVCGELSPELDALHAYRAAANMGTLTGAPKLRAMELIRETEPFSRGFYGGAVGYLLADGTFDSCIVIRSLRYREDGRYETRAGAGIVADSIPERELAETAHKARACLQAIAVAEASA